MGLSILMGSEEDWGFLSSWETLTCSLSAPSSAFGWLFSITLRPCPCVPVEPIHVNPQRGDFYGTLGFIFDSSRRKGGMTLLTYNLKMIVVFFSFAKIALVFCLFTTELLWKMLFYERLRYDRCVLLFLIAGKA